MVKMEHLTILFLLQINVLFSEASSLEENCLACHKKQQIPSYLAYKRYLMKYSTSARMEDAIYNYLKHPHKESSIMPPQFFLKFPMKQPVKKNENQIRKNIRAYLDHFDIKKRLTLEE